ncbi:hypothetical protein CDAR_289241 [Caerostris darwini]|uniref:Uncharacterized protein n=1 Tax=Caerostris darwini TaxID=1538125 RepID=A0AAV4PEJ6_9ARAC|nr:hypothetical protein CDAR_289241 [Caerostris darwini]
MLVLTFKHLTNQILFLQKPLSTKKGVSTYNATIKIPFAHESHFTSQVQHSLQQIRMQHYVHRWSEKQMRESVTPCWVPFTDYLPVFEKGMIAHETNHTLRSVPGNYGQRVWRHTVFRNTL